MVNCIKGSEVVFLQRKTTPMKNIFLIISLLFTSLIFAQTGTVEGVVKDASANNDPMMFATVTINETKQSITTGFRGGYFFKDLKPGKYTLIYNFLGYESITKKIEVKEEKIILDASLKQSTDINFEAVELTSN